MQLFALIAVQALAVILIVGNSPQSQSAKAIRHTIKQVLGITYFAQDTTDQTQPTDQQQPQDQQPQQPAEQPQAQQQTPQATSQPAETTTVPQPPESPAPTESQPTAQPSEVQPTEMQTTPTPEGQIESQQTAANMSNNQQVPVVDDTAITANDTVSSTETITSDVTSQAERNDKIIDSATSPDEKSADILTSEQEDTSLLKTSIQNNNFSSASFLTQRLITNLQTLQSTLPSTTNQSALQNQLTTFCDQNDSQLRTQQLVVPENMEQDIEIARSLCR